MFKSELTETTFHCKNSLLVEFPRNISATFYIFNYVHYDWITTM